MTAVFVSCAILIAVVMIVTWVVSLFLKDASIVDPMWGLTFVLATAMAYWVGDPSGAHGLLLLILVAVWGLRLFFHLTWRKEQEPGEDKRYAKWRKEIPAWPITSLFMVFLLQGALLWVVALPIMLAMADSSPDRTWIWVIPGALLWATGVFFEAVGDLQLARFKADPGNKGKVMDQGLWRYTRHPNYFGDACVWWGLYLVALASSEAWPGFIGPVLMTFLLLKVSGVAMLEKSITSRRPGYAEYIRRTSAFIPLPPKK
jgi:steroid 5-alpha reductase family enzyme